MGQAVEGGCMHHLPVCRDCAVTGQGDVRALIMADTRTCTVVA